MLKKFSLFLSPFIFQAALSFFMLPVTTYVLGPKDYGIYAIVTAFTSFGVAIATMGSGYLLAVHYHAINTSEKQRMISTMLAIGAIVASLFSILIFVLWLFFFKRWEMFAVIPLDGIALALVTMAFTIPWTIAIDTITLDGKARLYAIAIIAQSIASAIAVTISLYIFKLGMLSLFVAGTTGAIIVFVSAMIQLRSYIRFSNISQHWAKEILKFSGVITVGNILESLQVLVERHMLSLYVGLSQLGIYSHSQQYRNLVMMTAKANARAIWPITLSEAREEQSNFYMTRKAWNIVYIGITIIGLFFALFGRDIIGLLTHNKFIEAQIFVTLWILFILIQNTGKAETGILYAYGKGILYSKLLIGSVVTSILLVLILVPIIGLFGAVLAVITQQIILRIVIQFYTKRIYRTEFSDWGVLIGSALILVALWLSRYFQFTVIGNLILFLFLLIVLGILYRTILIEIVLKIFNLLNLRVKNQLQI